MKIAGIILLVIGLIGTILFGIQAMQDSESFGLFGVEVVVSKANWTPLIGSGAILLIGVIMTFFGKK